MQHPRLVTILLFLFLEMIMVASGKTDKDLGYIERHGRILPSPAVLAGVNTTLAQYLSPSSGYLIAANMENIYFMKLVGTVNYILERHVKELKKVYPKAVRQLKKGTITVTKTVYDLLQRVPATKMPSWREPERLKKLLSLQEDTFRPIIDYTPLTEKQMSDLEKKYVMKVLVSAKTWFDPAFYSDHSPDTITHYTMARWLTECCLAALNGDIVDEANVMVAVKILLLIYFPMGQFYVPRGTTRTLETTTSGISIAQATTTTSKSSSVAKYGKVGVALVALGLLGGLIVLITKLRRPFTNALSNRTALQVTTERKGGVAMNLVLVSVLVAVFILLVVVIICWRRRGKRAKRSDAEDSEKNQAGVVKTTGATGSPPSLSPYSSKSYIDANSHDSPLFRQLAMKKAARKTTTDRLPWSVPLEPIPKERSNINVHVKVRSAVRQPHWRGRPVGNSSSRRW